MGSGLEKMAWKPDLEAAMPINRKRHEKKIEGNVFCLCSQELKHYIDVSESCVLMKV
jgi:hypothetical protein